MSYILLNPFFVVVLAVADPSGIAQKPIAKAQNSVITELPNLHTKSAEIPESFAPDRSVITEISSLSPTSEPANDR